ncbi:MAG: arylsulfatase [Planctomycetota bacterium]|nr:MAG: arylsulfatase [Planctomycetota bacterium]
MHRLLNVCRWIVGVAVMIGSWVSGVVAADAAGTNRPNVLVILADDLGYGDVQCYNPKRGRIPTPHIDQLAAQGMRFTDAHSSSGVCSPSRYTLLTGRYHWRTRLQAGIVGLWGAPLIAPERMTIATLARQQGYQTAAIGKWHLGWDWPIAEGDRPLFQGFPRTGAMVTAEHRAAWLRTYSQPIAGGPTTRGFDRYFGTDVPNWPPYCFLENDRTVGIPNELLDESRFSRNHHASLQGPALPGWQMEPILPTLADRACAFITEAAAQPTPFLLYLPLTTPHTPLAVNAEWKGKSGLDNDCADLIMETDAMVGRVLAALESTGEAGQTLVLLTSDNGFASYVGAKHLEQRGHFPSGPLRGYKTDVYEGGHRVPFIIRWPEKVSPGTVCSQLVHQADLIATLAEILGTMLPVNAGEDSFSILPLLKGQDQPVREHAVSCASVGTPGLRVGPWKLIAAPAAQGGDAVRNLPQVQLYHLSDDLGETTDLAEKHPERVAEMQQLLEKIIRAGRSTPGPQQKNDIRVVRFPKPHPKQPAK